MAKQNDRKVERFDAQDRIESHVYNKPMVKSNMEIFHSYEKELQAAGFTVDLAYSKKRGMFSDSSAKCMEAKGTGCGTAPAVLGIWLWA